jgi:FkbM family methyltransferase
MRTLFYRIIYFPAINFLIRNFLYVLKSLLPTHFKIPVSGTIKINNGEGGKIKFFSNETCPMARHLYWEDKNASFEFSEIFKSVAKQSNVFLDVGANVGYYSLLGASLNKDLKIYAFEPSKGPRYFLNKNIALNGFDKITQVNKACADKSAILEFYEEKNAKYPYIEHHASGIGNTNNTWGIENFTKYEVQAISLDEFVDANAITGLDLIKMDTEGTENYVLTGALKCIRRFKPIIICEVLENKIEKEVQDIIKNKLEGYTIFKFKSQNKKLHKVNDLLKENIDGENNYFFVHESREKQIETFIQVS